MKDDDGAHIGLLSRLKESLRWQFRVLYFVVLGALLFALAYLMIGETADILKMVAFIVWILCALAIFSADFIFSVVVTMIFLKRRRKPIPCGNVLHLKIM